MTGLHLRISTPREVLVEDPDALSVRAEDDSGGFGILPGHTEFLTALGPSVVRWRDRDDKERFCAVRAGVLTVRGGAEVSIACREGILGASLAALEEEVRSMRAAEIDAARRAQVDETRLHARAVRQLMRQLMSGRGPAEFGPLFEDELS